MSGEERRFEITVGLCVKEEGPGQSAAKPFFNNELTYHDIGYDGLVMVEQVMMEMLAKLADQGVIKAQAMGLGEKLTALGVELKK